MVVAVAWAEWAEWICDARNQRVILTKVRTQAAQAKGAPPESGAPFHSSRDPQRGALNA